MGPFFERQDVTPLAPQGGIQFLCSKHTDVSNATSRRGRSRPSYSFKLENISSIDLVHFLSQNVSSSDAPWGQNWPPNVAQGMNKPDFNFSFDNWKRGPRLGQS